MHAFTFMTLDDLELFQIYVREFAHETPIIIYVFIYYLLINSLID